MSSTVQTIFTSTIPFSISSTGANIRSCDTEKFSHGGTPLVDENLETLQWEENSATRTLYNHSDRWLTKTWVTYCKGVFKGEEMVKGGEAFWYKCSRIIGIEICNPNFHKEFVTLDDSYRSGQQSCSGISLEDGWYPQSTAFKNQPDNLELSAVSSDHNYCIVPFKQFKCQKRLGLQECNRLIQLETSSESLSENNESLSRTIYLFASRVRH